jgi:hypothetical protein
LAGSSLSGAAQHHAATPQVRPKAEGRRFGPALTAIHMMAPLVIASRFCGLPDSGNGGYVCGFVAARLGGQAEITLPARLSTPLHDRSKRLTCRNA